jgi:hypothetical protein
MIDERFPNRAMSGRAMMLRCIADFALYNGHSFNSVDDICRFLSRPEVDVLSWLDECFDAGVAFMCSDGHISWAPINEAAP